MLVCIGDEEVGENAILVVEPHNGDTKRDSAGEGTSSGNLFPFEVSTRCQGNAEITKYNWARGSAEGERGWGKRSKKQRKKWRPSLRLKICRG